MIWQGDPRAEKRARSQVIKATFWKWGEGGEEGGNWVYNTAGGGGGGLIVIMSPKVRKKSVKCYISILEMKENNHVSEKII